MLLAVVAVRGHGERFLGDRPDRAVGSVGVRVPMLAVVPVEVSTVESSVTEPEASMKKNPPNSQKPWTMKSESKPTLTP